MKIGGWWNVDGRVRGWTPVSVWGKKTNKMQQYRWFIVNSGCWLLTLSQHVSGIFMPIFRRRTLVTACGVYFLVVLDVAVCGTVLLCWGCDHCEGCCSTDTVSTCFRHLYTHLQEKDTCYCMWSVFSGSAGCGGLRYCVATLRVWSVWRLLFDWHCLNMFRASLCPSSGERHLLLHVECIFW